MLLALFRPLLLESSRIKVSSLVAVSVATFEISYETLFALYCDALNKSDVVSDPET